MIAPEHLIDIDLGAQRLRWFAGGVLRDAYPISSARNGAGEIAGSERTPRGWHRIAAKIGAGCAVNTVFVARVPTGEIYTPALKAAMPGRDWILTRILWLAGLEPGRNLGGTVDSQARYIYLHGAPDDAEMGVPGSRGCVRLRNADLVTLFDAVPVGTRVYLHI